MNKLKKEELLDEFEKCYGHHPSSIRNEQAYQQIKEMIQKQFEYEKEVEKSIIALKKMRKGIQKQEVTEEWIEDKVTNLFIILNILRPSSNDVENTKTFIRLLYREAGCLVE